MSRTKQMARNILRRSETVQTVYEKRKNLGRKKVLTKLLPIGGVGAELGVHKGHLTPGLLSWFDPEILYVVDPWYLLESNWDWAAGDKSTVNAVARVVRRIRPALESGQAKLVIADDRDFLGGLEDNILDWAYLDSSHMYDHTLEELELLVNKVKRGGVIAGDDWQSHSGHRHHGVCRAVREFEDSGRLKLFYSDDSNHQWAARV